MSNVYVLTESVFTFGLLASLLLCAYAYERGGKLLAFFVGTAFGVLTLTRSAVQYFIVVVAALLRWEGKPRGFVALAVLGFLVVFGAWSVRNIQATGHMADNTLMIKFLSHGMYPDFVYKGEQDTYGYPYRYDPDSSAIESSTASVLTAILNRFRKEPIRHLRWFILGKPIVFWQWNIIQGMGDAYVYPVKASPYVSRPLFRWTHALSRFLHAPVVILGLLGSIFCWLPGSAFTTRSTEFCTKLIASLLIYYQVVHMIGAPFPRYSVPLQPLVYGMAMYFIWASYAWILARMGGEGTSPPRGAQ
jgi:hypothetical protein